MAPPARNPAAQPVRRSNVATTSVASRHEARHDVRHDETTASQLDWLQPALAIWLRDEAGPSVRMGDVHPTDGR